MSEGQKQISRNLENLFNLSPDLGRRSHTVLDSLDPCRLYTLFRSGVLNIHHIQSSTKIRAGLGHQELLLGHGCLLIGHLRQILVVRIHLLAMHGLKLGQDQVRGHNEFTDLCLERVQAIFDTLFVENRCNEKEGRDQKGFDALL